jgi:signal-transduction protein with cAMP-binding, CBS, and nucleotidyltransferase domain
MKVGIKAGDVMTRTFVSVSPNTTAADCAKQMIQKKVGSLIVGEKQKLVGILTEGDIIKAIAKMRDLTKIKASEIMTRKVVTLSPSDDIYDALVKMKQKKIRWLPVTVQGRVIGMITIKDIVVIEPELYDIVAEFTPIKEEEKKLKMIELRKRKKALEMGEVWVKEGECQECEAYGVLYNKGGMLICEDCKDLLE